MTVSDDDIEIIDEDPKEAAAKDDKGEEDEEGLSDSHEGESCAGYIQACRDEDGVVGEEICFPIDSGGMDRVWSECRIDSCPELEAQRPCTHEGHEGHEELEGVQYCFQTPTGSQHWGLCLSHKDCSLGASISCPNDDFGGWSVEFYLDDFGVPTMPHLDCDTPLVLSFDGETPAFAAPPPAARAFDISGAGTCLSPDWPTAATPWLALDRDRSGTIDGGHELFGNGTRLSSGQRAAQGFAALGELDSDSDGRITPMDAAWSELVLWADHDGDRLSSGWELLPLEAYGVEVIELDYRRVTECDDRGNCGIERAAFTFHDQGGARSGEIIDVYVACGA